MLQSIRLNSKKKLDRVSLYFKKRDRGFVYEEFCELDMKGIFRRYFLLHYCTEELC